MGGGSKGAAARPTRCFTLFIVTPTILIYNHCKNNYIHYKHMHSCRLIANTHMALAIKIYKSRLTDLYRL